MQKTKKERETHSNKCLNSYNLYSIFQLNPKAAETRFGLGIRKSKAKQIQTRNSHSEPEQSNSEPEISNSEPDISAPVDLCMYFKGKSLGQTPGEKSGQPSGQNALGRAVFEFR